MAGSSGGRTTRKSAEVCRNNLPKKDRREGRNHKDKHLDKPTDKAKPKKKSNKVCKFWSARATLRHTTLHSRHDICLRFHSFVLPTGRSRPHLIWRSRVTSFWVSRRIGKTRGIETQPILRTLLFVISNSISTHSAIPTAISTWTSPTTSLVARPNRTMTCTWPLEIFRLPKFQLRLSLASTFSKRYISRALEGVTHIFKAKGYEFKPANGY